MTRPDSRTRAVLLVACLLLSSCATLRESPRKPFAHPPGTAAQMQERVSERQTFRVLGEWHWEETLRPGRNARRLSTDNALGRGPLGLFPGTDFRLATGECADCRIPAAALWYFRNEVIAVPKTALPEGTAHPSASSQSDRLPPYPLFVWVGAPQVIEHAELSVDGQSLAVDGKSVLLALMPKLLTNRAYADRSTVRFFQQRLLRVRGALLAEHGREMFVVRTFWPEDTHTDPDALTLEPLQKSETLSTLIEAQTGSIEGLFPARLLWERQSGQPRQWAGRPVLAFVLSGAQSDDDLSLAGHLAVATGRFGQHGDWSDWLVDNFYPLDKASEKGILPAVVPMDNYLLDLNRGEAYYRPSYMLVAVLQRPRVAYAIQAALQEEMSHLYCHDTEFDLATRNSTAMSMDPLRVLGWRIPRMGATSYLAAIAAVPVAAVVRRSLGSGLKAFNFLTEEQTRLMPRAAFEVLGQDLLYLVSAGEGGEGIGADTLTSFERMLAEDIEALLFVRIPQVPSSRPFGTYPVRSLIDYGARVYTAPGPMKRPLDAGRHHLPQRLVQACKP